MKCLTMMSLTVLCSMLFVTAVFAASSGGYDATIGSNKIAVLSTGGTEMNPGFHTSIWKHTLTGGNITVETDVTYKVWFTTKHGLGYNDINQNTVNATLQWNLGGNYAVTNTWSRVAGTGELFAEFGYYNW